MSTMIERVARALCRSTLNGPNSTEAFKTRYCDTHWPSFSDNARIAIEAMREPTGAMVGAGDNAYVASLGGLRQYGGQDGTTVCWRSMIDEALK